MNDVIDPTQRLRATLRAAAPTDTHLEAGLADLRARFEGGTVVPLPASPAAAADARSRAARSRRPLLAAAAVILVAAAAAAGLAFGRDDDPGGTVGSGGPPTGWYVPTDLPAGWTLESVSAEEGDVEGFGGTCPCARSTWLAAERPDQILTLSSAANDGPLDPGASSLGVPVDLGGGRSGNVLPAQGGYATIIWLQGGRQWWLSGLRIGRDQVTSLARRHAADPASFTAPSGFRLAERVTAPGGVQSYRTVTVTLRNAETGAEVAYALTPPGLTDSWYLGAVRPDEVAGQPRRVLRRTEGLVGALPAYVGRWPGADITIGDPRDVSDAGSGEGGATPTEADLDRIVAALRPASAARWKAFVASARRPLGDEVVAATISDLTRPGEAQHGG